MSHFTVMVVTPQKPSEDKIAELLQPFHEFECTGVDDQYVQCIDIMEKAMAEFKEDTTRQYVDLDGKSHDPYQHCFYRHPTAEEKVIMGSGPHGCGGNGQLSWNTTTFEDGYCTKIHFLPDGWVDQKVPTETVKTFSEFIEGWYSYKCLPEGVDYRDDDSFKYGWYRVDADGNVIEVIDRTNPNKQWDWYQIGGRWSGLIRLRGDNVNGAWNGTRSRYDDPQKPNTYDSAQKADIDIEGMRIESRTTWAVKYDDVHNALGQYMPGFVTWEKMVEKHKDNWDKIREEYHAQELMVHVNEYRKAKNDLFFDIGEFIEDREVFLQKKEIAGFLTFAVLLDGKWYSRGEMGWFGAVSESKKEWELEFDEILQSIPADHWLTIVDCHI